MGCSVALLLARRGARVALIDEASVPFANASRWNEGKIHLGYLYAGDPSLATARKLVPGGLAFKSIVEELIGSSIDDAITRVDDIYLTHRDSVVDAPSMAAYIDKVTDLIHDHPDAQRHMLGSGDARPVRMTARELSAVTSSAQIVAGFWTPERSVQTSLLADRFIQAVDAEKRIEKIFNCRVEGIAESAGVWNVKSAPASDTAFDVIVNALWQGRAAVDTVSGFNDGEIWSYRYRLSLFVKTSQSCRLPSVMIATGPFGDIKNYNGRDLYLSWYPAGLVVDSTKVSEEDPPSPGAERERAVLRDTIAGLMEYFPDVPDIVENAESVKIVGGWVIAPGSGSLADPASSLHRRDRFGVKRIGSYYSVDTGKYSTAPWLARRIADEILG